MKKNERTLKIYFENGQSAVPVTPHVRALVRRAVLATLAYENVTGPSEVSVTFTDHEGIRQRNNRFRGLDSETDVLSCCHLKNAARRPRNTATVLTASALFSPCIPRCICSGTTT